MNVSGNNETPEITTELEDGQRTRDGINDVIQSDLKVKQAATSAPTVKLSTACSVVMRNLHYVEDEEYIGNLFNQVGNVEMVAIKNYYKGGSSFAIITYKSAEQALAAVRAFDQQTLKGIVRTVQTHHDFIYDIAFATGPALSKISTRIRFNPTFLDELEPISIRRVLTRALLIAERFLNLSAASDVFTQFQANPETLVRHAPEMRFRFRTAPSGTNQPLVWFYSSAMHDVHINELFRDRLAVLFERASGIQKEVITITLAIGLCVAHAFGHVALLLSDGPWQTVERSAHEAAVENAAPTSSSWNKPNEFVNEAGWYLERKLFFGNTVALVLKYDDESAEKGSEEKTNPEKPTTPSVWSADLKMAGIALDLGEQSVPNQRYTFMNHNYVTEVVDHVFSISEADLVKEDAIMSNDCVPSEGHLVLKAGCECASSWFGADRQSSKEESVDTDDSEEAEDADLEGCLIRSHWCGTHAVNGY